MGISRFAVAALALACVLPACAVETADEDVAESDDALEAAWGEIDEDATPIAPEEVAEALGDDEDDSVEGGADDADEPPADAEAVAAPPPLPARCKKATSLDLVVYTEGYSAPILKALADRAKPCSRYTVAVPKRSGSPTHPDNALWPRPVRGKGVRAYGQQFVASAEVHWGGARAKGAFYPGWKNVKVVKTGPAQYKTVVVPRSKIYDNDWYLKGVLFRQRMAKAGFRPQAGDTWHINELESGWTRTRVAQKAIRALVRGLADGDREYDAAKDPDPEIVELSAAEKAEVTKAARKSGVRGIAFVSSLGRRRPGEKTRAAVDAALKQTLRHRRFWADMADNVSSFAVERYLSFAGNCKKSLAAQSDEMAGEIMELELEALHAPRYRQGKRAGKSTVATALSYLSRGYHPVINAAWGFHNDGRSLGDMRSFVAGQVQATRAYANRHNTPDGRIGIYFKTKDGATPAKTAAFASGVAASLNAAYNGAGGDPLAACGGSGAKGCVCGD